MDSVIAQGFLGGLLAGLATGIGALGVYSVHRLSRPANDVLLAGAGGIMLAATFFSLLGPGIEVALAENAPRLLAAAIVGAGMLAGAALLALVHRLIPHEHFSLGREGPEATRVRRVWLFVLAIALHNVPEGMAVGVGFGAGDVASGIPLAVGIGLQNVPEGLAVAAGLTAIGYSPTRAFLLSLGTGILEAVGALFGAAGASLAGALLPFALAFAAGAMLFVIASEIIPESVREETKLATTFALLAGFLVMMTLDIALG
jgi:ZIP family zinc transporter